MDQQTLNLGRTDPTTSSEQEGARRFSARWFAFGGVLFLLTIILFLFDDSTELLPNHDGVLAACLWVAALSGVVCFGLAIRGLTGIGFPRRLLLASLLGFLTSLLVFMVTGAASEVVEGLIDFPPGKTIRHEALIPIARAYQTRKSWTIETMPTRSSLHITQADYQFMQTHRWPGDEGLNPDRISSQGYFCAHVTIEVAGNASRVIHAGTHTLPAGTVVVCPSADSK